MLELGYRQVKRLWQPYREAGRQGLKHGNAGRPLNRRQPLKLRRRVLHWIRKKYSGSEEERFGPTLAAEHLAEADNIVLEHDTVRRWMLEEGLWSRQRKRTRPANEGSPDGILASWYSWMEVSMIGSSGNAQGTDRREMVEQNGLLSGNRLGPQVGISHDFSSLSSWFGGSGSP
jgi:hypothetical protein